MYQGFANTHHVGVQLWQVEWHCILLDILADMHHAQLGQHLLQHLNLMAGVAPLEYDTVECIRILVQHTAENECGLASIRCAPHGVGALGQLPLHITNPQLS